MPLEPIETDEYATRAPRAVALPIHPRVTLEQWVAAAQCALVDGGLSPDEEIGLFESIYRDPAAVELYEQACRDEQLMMSLFSRPADPASPLRVA